MIRPVVRMSRKFWSGPSSWFHWVATSERWSSSYRGYPTQHSTFSAQRSDPSWRRSIRGCGQEWRKPCVCGQPNSCPRVCPRVTWNEVSGCRIAYNITVRRLPQNTYMSCSFSIAFFWFFSSICCYHAALQLSLSRWLRAAKSESSPSWKWQPERPSRAPRTASGCE